MALSRFKKAVRSGTRFITGGVDAAVDNPIKTAAVIASGALPLGYASTVIGGSIISPRFRNEVMKTPDRLGGTVRGALIENGPLDSIKGAGRGFINPEQYPATDLPLPNIEGNSTVLGAVGLNVSRNRILAEAAGQALDPLNYIGAGEGAKVIKAVNAAKAVDKSLVKVPGAIGKSAAKRGISKFSPTGAKGILGETDIPENVIRTTTKVNLNGEEKTLHTVIDRTTGKVISASEAATSGTTQRAVAADVVTTRLSNDGTMIGTRVMPPIPEGHTRLYRGEHPLKARGSLEKEDIGRWFSDKEALANEFSSGVTAGTPGDLYYVDVPTASLDEWKHAAHEFVIPKQVAAQKDRVPYFRYEDIPTPVETQIPANAGGGSPPTGPPSTVTGGGDVPQGGRGGITLPTGTKPLVAPGSRAALEQAAIVHNTQVPGWLGKALHQVPLLDNVLSFVRPIFDQSANLYIAQNAQKGVFSYMKAAGQTYRTSLKELGALLGDDVVHGATSKVDRFIGTEAERVPWVNTLLDMASRSHLYNLEPELKAAMTAANLRTKATRLLAVDEYGADIAEYPVRDGGMFLTSINKSKTATDVADMFAGKMAVGRTAAKPRIFESAADRYLNDMAKLSRGEIKKADVFEPELDVGVIFDTMTNMKASLAANKVFKDGVGGFTLSEAKEQVAPHLVKAKTAMQKLVDSLSGKVDRAEAAAAKHGYAGARMETELTAIRKRVDNFIGQFSEEGEPTAATLLQAKAKELLMREASLTKALTRQQLAQVNKEAAVRGIKPQLMAAEHKLENLKFAYSKAINLKDRGLIEVGHGINRYFPKDEALQLNKLMQLDEGGLVNSFINAVNNLSASKFSGDVGLIFGQQGPIAMLTHPMIITKSIAGALKRGMSDKDIMAALGTEDIDWTDPSLWQFAQDTGVVLQGPVPQELAGGWLGKAPIVGKYWSKFNRTVYTPIVKATKSIYDETLQDMLSKGFSLGEARAAAGEYATSIIPTATPALTGRSRAAQSLLRLPFTSLTFIEKPVSLYTDGVVAIGKAFTKQTLTPRDHLAGKAVLKLASSISMLAATSNAIWAVKTGRDPLQAALDSIDPHNPKNGSFWTLRFYTPGVGWVKIPLGGPYRAILRTVMPQKVDTPAGEMWLPGANIEQFLENRGQPVGKAALELVRNKTFYDKKTIATADETWKRRVQQATYFAEQMLPLTADQPIQSYKEGQPLGEAIATTVGQFSGENVNVGSQTERLDTAAFSQYKKAFKDLDPYDQDNIVADNPALGRIAASSLGLYQGGLEEKRWSDVKDVYGLEEDSYKKWAEKYKKSLVGDYKDVGYDQLEAEVAADKLFNKSEIVKTMRRLTANDRNNIIKSQPNIARAAAEQGWLSASSVLKGGQ